MRGLVVSLFLLSAQPLFANTLALPQLARHYFYGDFCSGDVWSFLYKEGRATDARNRSRELRPEGEIYVLDYAAGVVYRMVPGASR